MKQNMGNLQYRKTGEIIEVFTFPECLIGSIKNGEFTAEHAAHISDNSKRDILAIIAKEFPPAAPQQSVILSELEEARQNLSKRQAAQATMRNANALIRKSKDDASAKAELIKIGIPERKAHELLNPKYTYEKKGFQGWELTNNNANITRLIERVQTLEKKEEKRQEIATAENSEQPEETINGVTICKDYEDDRIRLNFPGKPTPQIIAALKANGWRWAPSVGAWSRKLTRQAELDAVALCKQVQA